MLSIGPSCFILGLVVASVTAQSSTTQSSFSTTLAKLNDSMNTTEPPLSTYTSMTVTSNISSTTIIIDRHTPAKRTAATPTPMQTKSTEPATKTKDNLKDKTTTAEPKGTDSDNTGIIILVVIILVAVGFGVACYLARKRGRRYSVDFTSRPDEANIPLSIVEPGLPADSVSQNGLQTFETTELITKTDPDPQEPEVKPEEEKEQKAEADKPVDPSAESAAPAPSPDSAEDKPKEDVAEQSPAAPVEPSVEEKTDDEGVVSNKTSVESLKETNENNSNNADFSQMRDLKPSSIFWDIPLDCPV